MLSAIDAGQPYHDRNRVNVPYGLDISGSVLPQIRAGHWRRVLLVATGALFSPTSYQQGETIPGIAHAIEFIHVQARP